MYPYAKTSKTYAFSITKLLKKDVDTFYYYLWPSALGIKPVSAKGNPPRILTGRIDAEVEAPIFWTPDVKRPWCWERLRVGEEGGEEDEMVAWQHQLNGHEFEHW